MTTQEPALDFSYNNQVAPDPSALTCEFDDKHVAFITFDKQVVSYPFGWFKYCDVVNNLVLDTDGQTLISDDYWETNEPIRLDNAHCTADNLEIFARFLEMFHRIKKITIKKIFVNDFFAFLPDESVEYANLLLDILGTPVEWLNAIDNSPFDWASIHWVDGKVGGTRTKKNPDQFLHQILIANYLDCSTLRNLWIGAHAHLNRMKWINGYDFTADVRKNNPIFLVDPKSTDNQPLPIAQQGEFIKYITFKPGALNNQSYDGQVGTNDGPKEIDGKWWEVTEEDLNDPERNEIEEYLYPAMTNYRKMFIDHIITEHFKEREFVGRLIRVCIRKFEIQYQKAHNVDQATAIPVIQAQLKAAKASRKAAMAKLGATSRG
jgi:hypothetical protein